MTKNQYAEFFAIMKRAATLTYQQKNKDFEELAVVMFEELGAYELEDVRSAVANHVRYEKFFPMLADIIKRIEGTAEERAALAWQTVLKAIRMIGSGNSIRFPSPAYHYAIEQMGGWMKLCSTLTVEEEKWRGKDFVRFFEIGERVASWEHEPGNVHVPPYLMGWHEINNRRGRDALPDIVDAETGILIAGIREALPEPGESSGIVMRLVRGMRAG